MPDIDISTDLPPDTVYTRYLNQKYYELTDHLGNVRAVLGDRKLTATPGAGNYYADVRSYSHPYPFGMPQPGRTWSNSPDYRYGFNGMETDPEVKEASRLHYTTYFRQYDPRLGRWWSNDPVVQQGESPYAAMYNNPILFSDPFGDCPGCDDPKNLEVGTGQTVDGQDYIVGTDPDGRKIWVDVIVKRERRLTPAEAEQTRQRREDAERLLRDRRDFERISQARREYHALLDDYDQKVMEWGRNEGPVEHFIASWYLFTGGAIESAEEMIAEDQISGFVPGLDKVQAMIDIKRNGPGFWNIVGLLPIPGAGKFDEAAEGIQHLGDELFEGADAVSDSRKITAGPTPDEIAGLPKSNEGWLQFHEKWGGHTIERHVGIPDDDLVKRLKENKKIKGSSSFVDQATAESVAGQAVNANRPQIEAWLRSQDPNNLVLPYSGEVVIGRGITREALSAGEAVSNYTSAIVVLKRADADPTKYLILTSYPKP